MGLERAQSILMAIIVIVTAMVSTIAWMPQPYNWICVLALGGPLFVSIMAYRRNRDSENIRKNENMGVSGVSAVESSGPTYQTT